MIANGDLELGAPSDCRSITGKFETFGKEPWRQLEEQALEQRHMHVKVHLYLGKGTVLHRLGKARTEWQEAVCK